MNQYEQARESVKQALSANGMSVTFTREVRVEDVAAGGEIVQSSSIFTAIGIFKNINSLLSNKSAAMVGDFESTDEVFLTVDDVQKRDKFTRNGKSYDVVAVIPTAPTDIVIKNECVVRAL